MNKDKASIWNGNATGGAARAPVVRSFLALAPVARRGMTRQRRSQGGTARRIRRRPELGTEARIAIRARSQSDCVHTPGCINKGVFASRAPAHSACRPCSQPWEGVEAPTPSALPLGPVDWRSGSKPVKHPHAFGAL